MNLRELKNMLLPLTADDTTATQALMTISHWIGKIRSSPSGKYYTDEFDNIRNIQKLEPFGIVKIEKRGNGILVKLTQSGKELYKDFYAHNYY